MVNERRVARLAEMIHKRVAEILAHEMSDPRLGFVTVTRVDLDRELSVCKVHWSCLGDEKKRTLSEHALAHARGFVQREVAKIMKTRTVPELRFLFDESIAGAIRIHNLIDQVVAQETRTPSDPEPPLEPPLEPEGGPPADPEPRA
jgi:ribosome-binding factor A